MFGYQVISKIHGKEGFIATDAVLPNGTVIVIYKGDTDFHFVPLSSLKLNPIHIVDEEEGQTAKVFSLVPDDETTH